jgi:hypothetical protein
LADAGRDLSELELVGGTRREFADATGVADLEQALGSIPGQIARGFGSFCLKPSQFTDDPADVGPMCRTVVERLESLAR